VEAIYIFVYIQMLGIIKMEKIQNRKAFGNKQKRRKPFSPALEPAHSTAPTAGPLSQASPAEPPCFHLSHALEADAAQQHQDSPARSPLVVRVSIESLSPFLWTPTNGTHVSSFSSRPFSLFTVTTKQRRENLHRRPSNPRRLAVDAGMCATLQYPRPHLSHAPCLGHQGACVMSPWPAEALPPPYRL
jgi:hypothetical protein